VLYRLTPPSNLVRHRCRNPRCGAKLKSSVVNRLDAFCCQGCFDNFYRSHCLVCEQLFTRKTARRQVCHRSRCRHEFQRHRERFSGTRYLASVLGLNASRSAHSTGLKIGQKPDRPLRQVAGPKLSSTSLWLASLPLDPEFAARIAKANAPYFEALAKSKRVSSRRAIIKRRHPPVNVLGGHHFPDAPVVDLSPIDGPEWAITSRWKPTGAGADVPPIPDFLQRHPATATTPTVAAKEPSPSPATAPSMLVEQEKAHA
jgi:hypothetical protein